jgi:hypothetical protein
VARSGEASRKERTQWVGSGATRGVRGVRWEPRAARHDGLRRRSRAAEGKQRRKKNRGRQGLL